MNSANTPEKVQAKANQVAKNRWVAYLARFGYITKGIVYLLVGILAVQLAFGLGGRTTDQRGALQTIANQPFGQALMCIVAIGLFGYALWSEMQAILDVDRKGKDAKGILSRLGYAGIGISYIALGIGAFHLATSTGGAGKNSTDSAQDWTARLLQMPFGVVLVVIVGLIVLGIAIALFVKVYKASFQQALDLSSLSPGMREGVMLLGRIGHAALGVVFVIISIFLILAALQHNPNEAKGLDSALLELTHQPFGAVLLAIIALGFVAYGLYCFIEARYHNIQHY